MNMKELTTLDTNTIFKVKIFTSPYEMIRCTLLAISANIATFTITTGERTVSSNSKDVAQLIGNFTYWNHDRYEWG